MTKESKSCIWPTFYKGYITGIVESCVLFDEFSKEALCQLLPPGYRLARQTIARPGMHPIYWCFNLNQKKVGTPLPFLCLNYHEFAFVIPFVQCTAENNIIGAYVPVLYLNSLAGVLGGKFFYQLNKSWKKCRVSPTTFDDKAGSEMFIEGLNDKKHILTSSFQKSGKSLPYQESKNFMRVKPMLDQELISHGLWGYKSSKFILNYDGLNIQPISGNVKTVDFIDGFQNIERKIPSIEDSTLGGFYFNTNWQLNLPKT
jgi:hypothetical protein